MNDINSINLTGRLTKDIDIKHVGDLAIGNFTMAVNTYAGSKKGEVTHFFDCTVFAQQAKLMEDYTQKGSKIGISGELEQQRWENKDGQKRSKVVVKVKQVTLLESIKDRKDKKTDEAQKTQAYVDTLKSKMDVDEMPYTDDDVPF